MSGLSPAEQHAIIDLINADPVLDFDDEPATAPCGCPFADVVVDGAGDVDHTKECLKRQAAEDKARDVAAGLVAFGHLIAANPHLTAAAPYTAASGQTSISVFGRDARAAMEQFIAAFCADGWALTECESGNYVGVEGTKYGLRMRVLADPKDLADEPQPPRPTYRPLLAPANEAQAGA